MPFFRWRWQWLPTLLHREKVCDPQRLLDVVDYYAGDLDAQERELLESRL